MVDTVERDLLMPVMAMVVTVEDTEVTEVPMEVSEEVMEVTMVDTEDMDGECIFVFSITLNTPHRGLVIIFAMKSKSQKLPSFIEMTI